MHHHIIEAALGAVAALALPAAIIGMSGETGNAVPPEAHQTLAIGDTLLDYPLPGEFLAGGVPVAAPVKKTAIPEFHIMQRQVSLADYGRCVADGACDQAEAARSNADVPVTGVSTGLCQLVLQGEGRELAPSHSRRIGRRSSGTFCWGSLSNRRRRCLQSLRALVASLPRGSGGEATARSETEAARPLRVKYTWPRGLRRQCLGVDIDLLCADHHRSRWPRRKRHGQLRRPCARRTPPGLHVDLRPRRQERRMRRWHTARKSRLSPCPRQVLRACQVQGLDR